MAKSFFDLRDDIFETLTEASALERRAEREQKQADMAKVAADQDRKRRRAREARQDYSRERKRSLEMGEAVKVGDSVHLGHGTKGGTGVKGKVHKIDGKMVHIKNDKGDTFKGPMDRVTTKEAIKYDVDKGDTGTVTGKGKRDRSGKGEVEVKYTSKERPSYTAVIKPKDMAMHLRAARKGEKGKTLIKNVRRESVELEEAKAKDIVKGLTDMDGPFTVVAIKNNKVIKQEGTKMRNMLPAIVKMMRKDVGRGVTIGIEDKKGTIRGTFKEAVKPAMRMGVDFKYKAPSEEDKAAMKREREKAAKMRSTPDTSAAGRAAQRMIDARKKTEESVEQVDELMMPAKDSEGKIERGKIRAALRRGAQKADLKADKALRKGDAEGAEDHMTRSRKRQVASKDPEKAQRESVEQVDELKSSTLRSYLDKARKDNQTRVTRMADQPDHMSADKGEMRKLRKRRKGSEAAASRLDARKHNLEPKLKREEIEQVDELDTKTLKSYIHKASGQVRGDLYTGKHSPKTNKRAKGVAKAKTDLDMRKIAGKDYRKRMG